MSVKFSLSGRTALVTGGASGIGLETTKQLCIAGVKVAVNYLPGDPRGPEALEALKREGYHVLGAPGDVGDAEEAKIMVLKAIKDLGRLDLLVNNVGTPGLTNPVPIEDLDGITEELWTKLLNVNLMSVFRCSKAAADALKDSGGSIVNMASIAGMGAVSSSIVYSASKAAVINLTKNLARSLAPNVRVNAVAPGTVDSSWSIEWSKERHDHTIKATPLGRVCTTADVAELTIYLGFGASMVTGQTVAIDGGIYL